MANGKRVFWGGGSVLELDCGEDCIKFTKVNWTAHGTWVNFTEYKLYL